MQTAYEGGVDWSQSTGDTAIYFPDLNPSLY